MRKFLTDNRGQALVEFVLILPVFIFLVFTIYDFGMIFNKKNNLENASIDIIDLYRSGKSLAEIEGLYSSLEIDILEEDDYDKITIEDNVKLITPGLNLIFGNPYRVSVVRYTAHDE